MQELKNPALEIAKNTNFTNSYSYLKNVVITEWDIASAGFSVLKFHKILPEKELEKLSKMEKHRRTVYEGNLQKNNPIIAEKIIETLSKVRQAFVFLNKIPAENILAIKKDAIFLINFTPKVTTIKDVFVFRKKNTYTSFMQFNKKEFYYNSETNILHPKGISKEGVKLQEKFLLKDIKQFLKASEKVDNVALYNLLRNFRNNYLTLKLPIQYYRELDTGMYRFKHFVIKSLPESEKGFIDHSQNYMNYILPMIQLLV